MDWAAVFPLAIASMAILGPNAASPPANIPGAVVARVIGSILIVPPVVISMPSFCEMKLKSTCWPIAKITESCFYSLDGPIERICSLDVPISCCPSFEKKTIPSIEKIEQKIIDMLDE